jgi:hypothetical protein
MPPVPSNITLLDTCVPQTSAASGEEPASWVTGLPLEEPVVEPVEEPVDDPVVEPVDEPVEEPVVEPLDAPVPSSLEPESPSSSGPLPLFVLHATSTVVAVSEAKTHAAALPRACVIAPRS